MIRLVLFATVGLVASLVMFQPAEAPPPDPVDSLAPDFALLNEAGDEVRLTDYRGKLVFLNFWATWCGGCVDELPEMMELNSLLAGRSFQMLAVSVDTSWTPIVDFFDSNGIRIPTLLYPGQHVRLAYQVFAYPETFLVDGEGRIVRKYIGWHDWTSPKVFGEIEEHLLSVERRSSQLPAR